MVKVTGVEVLLFSQRSCNCFLGRCSSACHYAHVLSAQLPDQHILYRLAVGGCNLGYGRPCCQLKFLLIVIDIYIKNITTIASAKPLKASLVALHATQSIMYCVSYRKSTNKSVSRFYLLFKEIKITNCKTGKINL